MKRLVLAAFPIVLLLLTAGYFFGVKVKKISCKTQYGPCPPEVETQIQKIQGQSIYSAGKSLQNFFKGKEGVEGYFIQYRLPSNLEVTVQQAKPEFGLQYKESQVVLLVDAKGEVLGIEQSANLPEIISDRAPKDTGEKVSAEELYSLGLIRDLYFSYNVSQASLEGDTVKVDLGKVFVWFPTQGDRDLQLAALKLILAQMDAKPEIFLKGKPTVDLRFKNPVIK